MRKTAFPGIAFSVCGKGKEERRVSEAKEMDCPGTHLIQANELAGRRIPYLTDIDVSSFVLIVCPHSAALDSFDSVEICLGRSCPSQTSCSWLASSCSLPAVSLSRVMVPLTPWATTCWREGPVGDEFGACALEGSRVSHAGWEVEGYVQWAFPVDPSIDTSICLLPLTR